ncbi:MAG: YgjV family protein [Oscillospiraceae bacterium]|nr:YgjV family protein [Oscillospiraceae bacterium]
MAYILSQIFGFLVFLFVFASAQTKNMKNALLCQIGCNGFGMLSYVLLGGFSGCGIYLIATIQSAIFYFIRKSGKDEPKWLNPVIIVSYLACSAATLKGWLDLVPMLAAVLCAVGLAQKKPTNYRIILLLNGAIWLIYDVFMGAYTMLASHIITVGSALLGLIRLDLRKKTETP